MDKLINARLGRLIVYLLVAWLTFLAPSSFAEQAKPRRSFWSACADLVAGKVSTSSETDEARLLRFLNAKGRIAEKKVFKHTGTTGESVFISRQDSKGANDTLWVSSFSHDNSSYTKDGDPRYSIQALGVPLALKLGFNIEKKGWKTVLTAPSAAKLKRLITKLNDFLVSKGRAPIGFLPVKSGFLEPEEILRLSIATEGSILMNFPYADDDPKIVIHEIGYHLAGILLPLGLLERAREITSLTVKFVEFLRAKKGVLSDTLIDKIIDQLIRDRSIELDIGTGDFASGLAGVTKLNPRSGDAYWASWMALEYALDYLARPSMMPIDAVEARLRAMESGKSKSMEIWKDKKSGFGVAVRMTKEESRIFKILVDKFMAANRGHEKAHWELNSASAWVEDVLWEKEARVAELLWAFEGMER